MFHYDDEEIPKEVVSRYEKCDLQILDDSGTKISRKVGSSCRQKKIIPVQFMMHRDL